MTVHWHPIEQERSRRAVELAILEGHRTRGAIVRACRPYLPVDTVPLVTLALAWLRGRGTIQHVKGVGWVKP